MKLDHLRDLRGTWVVRSNGQTVLSTSDPQEAGEAFEDCLPGNFNPDRETISLVFIPA